LQVIVVTASRQPLAAEDAAASVTSFDQEVLDDLALPSGKLRIRPGGSDGGHNGLRDLQRALGTNQYPRLRLGIDAPPPPIPGKQYVLGKFSAEQRKLIDPAIDRATGAILTWIDKGIATAMNQFNTVAEEKN